MAANVPPSTSNLPPSAPNDLPPPYSAVVGNPQYGFIPPSNEPYPAAGGPYPAAGGPYPAAGGPYPAAGGPYPQPKQFTPMGVYPHPTVVTSAQPQAGSVPPPPPGMSIPIGVVMPPAVGSEPMTVTCYNCGKVVTTRVTYTTAWHTHLVAGSICVTTMVCSLCCLGLIPYCFDSFKDAEHYCPNCSTFIGKSNKC